MTDRTATADRGEATGSDVGVLYVVEGLGSIAGNFLQVGIFFYTKQHYGWGLRENFTLAAAQGAVYAVGALAAHRLAAAVGPRRMLALLYATVALISLAPLIAKSQQALVAALLVYVAMMAVIWPILEGLVSVNVSDPKRLAQRVGVYNLVWSGTGAATLAGYGTVIEHWPAGAFAIPAIVHGLGAILMLTSPSSAPASSESAATRAPHPHAEPNLARARTVALWLSRISMPASYALVYALAALLPSLHSMNRIPTWAATLIGSVWLASRWVTFLVLGLVDWWHTRPRVLLVAAFFMLIAFALVAWEPSRAFERDALAIDLGWLVACQIVIGVAIGMIYFASLYFGMVLSEGSTEHGGYHEALIGLGSVLGPGAGAVAQWLSPGDLRLGMTAVTGVLLASTLLACVASIAASRRGRLQEPAT